MILGRSRIFRLTTVLLFIATGLSSCGGGSGSDTGGGFTGSGQGTQTSLSLKLGEQNQPVELEIAQQIKLFVQVHRGNYPQFSPLPPDFEQLRGKCAVVKVNDLKTNNSGLLKNSSHSLQL